MPPPGYLIDGFIREGGLNLLVGPSGIGKTLAALDMGLSIVTGIDWHGHRVEPGQVLYVAAEGVAGMHGRAGAWCRARQQPQPDGIGFVNVPLNLSNSRDVDLIIQAAVERDVDLIVIDPLARFMEGADENSSTDMGAALTAFGRIQHSAGATMLVIHHTGKDPSKGERGHSSLRAGADQVLMMKSVGALIEVKVDKARDAAGGDTVRFSLESVAKSAVLRTAGPSHEHTHMKPDELRALGALAATNGGATSTEWEVVSGLEHSPFQRAREGLSDRGLVSGGGGKGKAYQVTSEGREALARAGLSEP
jgi:hypothetical protein